MRDTGNISDRERGAAGTYTVEVRTRRRFPFRLFPTFRQTADGKYEAKGLSKREADACVLKARLLGYEAYAYLPAWDRNSSYRKSFLKDQPDICRCVYCGRLIPKESVSVDHIIPISIAKRSHFARLQLRTQGYSSINDPRNLVCACYACNAKKGNSNLFRYRFLARFGRYRSFWIIVRTLKIILILSILALALFFASYIATHSLQEVSDALRQGIEAIIYKIFALMGAGFKRVKHKHLP